MPLPETLPRRTLNELLAIQELESDFYHVIVEGIRDQTVTEWFLEGSGRKEFAVYEVDSFEVSAADVLARGLDDNRRGRVIALAYGVEAAAAGQIRVTCIADRDLDPMLNVHHDCRALLFTDYTCMLMYTFNERVLGKFLRFKLRRFRKTAAQIIRELTDALQVLFAVRLCKHRLAREMKSVPWQQSCALGPNGVELDLVNYVTRYLQKNRKHAERRTFTEHVHACLKQMRLDPRLQIRGHDFIRTLIWYVAQHRGFKSFGRVPDEVLEIDLLSCLELNDVVGEQLFQDLLTRVQE